MKINKLKFPFSIAKTITGAVIILVGLTLLINPGTSLVNVCYIFGITALLKGIIKIIQSKKTDNTKNIFSGIGTLIIAFLFLLHPKFLLSVFPVFIGLCILGYGIFSLLSNITILSRIISVVAIIAGISIIVVPFKFASAVTAVVGLGLVLTGIILIVTEFLNKKHLNAPVLTDSDGYTEVDFTDVDDN